MQNLAYLLRLVLLRSPSELSPRDVIGTSHGAWGQRALALFALCSVACGATACGATVAGTGQADSPGAPPHASADCVGAGCDAARVYEAGDAEAQALPRYFTLTVSGADALVDSRKLTGKALTRRIQSEASDHRNAGAAVLLDEQFSGETLGALVWELSMAGFVHIVVSRRTDTGITEIDTPAEPSMARLEPEPERPARRKRQEPVAEEPEPQQESNVDLSDVGVVVKNIGLHIGGGPNDDATKARYSAPISRYFDHFRKCHRLVDNPTLKASVGVDLLVGSKGGRAQVKDFRTALRGKGFEACATKVFGQVKFPAPERPTMISYSLLFKPSN